MNDNLFINFFIKKHFFTREFIAISHENLNMFKSSKSHEKLQKIPRATSHGQNCTEIAWKIASCGRTLKNRWFLIIQYKNVQWLFKSKCWTKGQRHEFLYLENRRNNQFLKSEWRRKRHIKTKAFDRKVWNFKLRFEIYMYYQKNEMPIVKSFILETWIVFLWLLIKSKFH